LALSANQKCFGQSKCWPILLGDEARVSLVLWYSGQTVLEQVLI